ncbi:MFS transporter [Pseudonocardia halophobica]|uniref:MFS transporter n=1 Tax=Pseudonocardia halophobica TaxID=29401 RepID=A0A9W6P131_9PSEU|nr:MFS transporter [Pseudonocardia halophobica]GLL15856.1 MFS transporter [Pseudonocardia halophobica]
MANAALTRRSWLTVGGSTLALTVGASPILLQTSGLFMLPLAEEYGWSRTEVSGAKSLAGLFATAAVLAYGYLIARHGLRRVMVPSLVLFSVALAGIAFTPGSLAIYYALVVVAACLGAAQNPPPYVQAVSGWFDRRRGLAIGIAVCGTGLGTSLVPQYTQVLIGSVGWRGAYVGLGLLVLVVTMPCWLLLVREPSLREREQLGFLPVTGSITGSGPTRELPGLTRREAVRTRQFWILAAATLIGSIALNGSAAHLVPMLTDRGMSPAEAAAVLLPVGVASLLGRPLAGLLLDRFHGPTVAAVQQLVPILGFVLIGTGWSPVGGAIAFGLSIGIEVDLASFMTSRYFGLRHFSKVYGFVFAIFQLGAAAGALAYAVSFDYAGTYAVAFWVIGVALVLTAAAYLALGTYRYPVHVRATEPDERTRTADVAGG